MVPEPLHVKLTKKVLMASPEGAFLVSNCMNSPRESIFEEFVSQPSERGEQWKAIIAVGADQRLCRVFRSKGDYQDWLASILVALKSAK